MRIEPAQIDQLLHPMFDAEELKEAEKLTKGLPASPGAATGQIYFNASDAETAVANGAKAILVRLETSPEDLAGMVAAEGILTARGGMTSHAAVVARGMGKCCVSGCAEIKVDEEAKELTIGEYVFKEGDYISLDGTAGDVLKGQIKTVPPELSGDFAEIMSWADEIRTLKIRTNADNPRDAKQAVEFGAEGIGLCRTEHMFFEEERIPAVRRMILADSEEERREALKFLLPYQKGDFKGIYEAMGDRPVTIRLLDPPLHEFLPHTDEEIKALSEQIGVPYEKLAKKTQELHEFNPMLGHRGCRLGIAYPEITEMQARAIFEAAVEVSQEEGFAVVPEIMVPLVAFKKELDIQKAIIDKVAKQVFEEKGAKVDYLVGTMIEIPRAAVTADEIAETAQFFSFGTNDLTQTGLGMSRDDSGSFLPQYQELEIIKKNVFASIDQEGVGKLMKIAVELGRSTRPDIKLGICGEHGGDPASVKFCNTLGLTYVSCSPYRVPTARLAAAQAALEQA